MKGKYDQLVESILGPVIVGFLGFLWFLFTSINTLDTEIASAKQDISETDLQLRSIESKIDDIHWYLIEKNKVKIQKDGRFRQGGH